MKYPNNDLWSVRQIEFLEDALKGYENTQAIYYTGKELSLDIPGIATYAYTGVIHFPGQDRTIILEQGEGYGLKKPEVIDYLKKKNIKIKEA
jgi:hypothetical protein